MSSKTPKTASKVMDVTKVKKTTSPTVAQPLVISERPILDRQKTTIKISEPIDEPTQTPVNTAPVLEASKRTIIKPLSDEDLSQPEETPATPNPVPTETKAAPATTISVEEKPEAPVTAAKPAASPDPANATVQIDSEPAAPVSPAARSNSETRKAVEEATAAAKRERELETYIDNRQFFVPINAVARKRSIKVSALLTIIVFLLAVILIDLMLDSGFIELIQRIPHTHFFDLSS